MWTEWRPLGGLAIAAPAVDVLGADTYRAMVVGTDGEVWQREVAADGGPTAGWASTGELTTFAPAASATAGWARDVRAVAYSEGVGVRQIWDDGTALDIGGVVTRRPPSRRRGARRPGRWPGAPTARCGSTSQPPTVRRPGSAWAEPSA